MFRIQGIFVHSLPRFYCRCFIIPWVILILLLIFYYNYITTLCVWVSYVGMCISVYMYLLLAFSAERASKCQGTHLAPKP